MTSKINCEALLFRNGILTLCAFFFAPLLSVKAQCISNMLTNPSFETPVVSTLNGNNLVGSSWGGWITQNGAGLNIIKVNGTTYTSGADVAAHGNQYVDIAGANDFPTQSFVLSVPSVVYFNGKFSNRETGGGFVDWTARVDILNSSSSVVASSNAKLMVSSLGMETWYMLGGESGVLPAGTYRYRAFVGDYGHFDDAFLCVKSASAICSNRISEAGFESPAQSGNNTATTLGTSINGWYTQNGSNVILTKVDGAGYSLGPDVAYQGLQYLSLSNVGDYLVRDFTITCATPLEFSGYFSNRPNGTYTNWTGRIDILNSVSTVVASSTTQAFTAATSQENWYLLYGTSASLPSGDYKIRITLGREGNFDAGYLCVSTSTCSTLPASWQLFTAKKQNDAVLLDWATADEKNVLDFSVQHSIDGRSWTNLHTVAANSSNLSNKHNFLHTHPAKNTNHYRILKREVNGNQDFSETKTVRLSPPNAVFSVVYNTVTNGQLMLKLSTSQLINVFNGDGQLMVQKIFSAGTHAIDVTNYPKGMYWLGNGSATEKVVVQ